MTGILVKIFTHLLEFPFIGTLFLYILKGNNLIHQLITNAELEESPLYVPLHRFEDNEEKEVKCLDPSLSPPEKVQHAIDCLPISQAKTCNGIHHSFHRWTIMDYSKAIRGNNTAFDAKVLQEKATKKVAQRAGGNNADKFYYPMEQSPSIQVDKLSGWDSLSSSDQSAVSDLVIKGHSMDKEGGSGTNVEAKEVEESTLQSSSKGGTKRGKNADGEQKSKAAKVKGDVSVSRAAAIKNGDDSGEACNIENRLEAQSKELWALKDDLKKHVTTAELREMLEANDQDSTGSELDLCDRWLVHCFLTSLCEFLNNYLAELSLLDYECIKFLPSVVAASVIFLARFIIKPEVHPWTSSLYQCSGYSSIELKECVLILHDLYLSRRAAFFHAVRDKYKQHKFKFVANLPSPPEVPKNYFEED